MVEGSNSVSGMMDGSVDSMVGNQGSSVDSVVGNDRGGMNSVMSHWVDGGLVYRLGVGLEKLCSFL